MSNDTNKEKPQDRIVNYFKSTANTSFLLRFLFYFNLFQLVVVVCALSLIGYQSCRIKYQVPLTIFVDRSTGVATPVDYRVVDARGEMRDELEVHYFSRTVLENLYTFNAHTVKSNLHKVLNVCAGDVSRGIMEILKGEDRAKMVSEGLQGICEIEKSSILETLPDLKVQVVFCKKVIGSSRTVLQGRYIATMRIKTITRQEGNWNGLVITEYKESKVREN
jgi:hypothetical protein